jgi:hypothetical protein
VALSGTILGTRDANRPHHARATELLLLHALMCSVLCACSPSAPDFYPTAPGKWWQYEVETQILGESSRHRLVVQNRRYDGRELLQQRQADRVYRLSVTPEGVFQPDASKTQDRSISRLLVPNNPIIGQQWEAQSELGLVESRTFDAQDRLRLRHLPVTLTARVAGMHETVTTTAGTFVDCLHLRLTGARNVRVDRGNGFAQVFVKHDEWYAPSVGLVKVTRVERTRSQFLRDGRYQQLLLEYGH